MKYLFNLHSYLYFIFILNYECEIYQNITIELLYRRMKKNSFKKLIQTERFDCNNFCSCIVIKLVFEQK
jgi:hypothetical protein